LKNTIKSYWTVCESFINLLQKKIKINLVGILNLKKLVFIKEITVLKTDTGRLVENTKAMR